VLIHLLALLFSVCAVEVPDEFYDITERDSRIYAKGIKAAAAVDVLHHSIDVSSKRAKDFAVTTLRIRLTGRLFVQGTFRSTETVADVRAFVAECLVAPPPPFYLCTDTPLLARW
jgi:hypothetical protein